MDYKVLKEAERSANEPIELCHDLRQCTNVCKSWFRIGLRLRELFIQYDATIL